MRERIFQVGDVEKIIPGVALPTVRVRSLSGLIVRQRRVTDVAHVYGLRKNTHENIFIYFYQDSVLLLPLL